MRKGQTHVYPGEKTLIKRSGALLETATYHFSWFYKDNQLVRGTTYYNISRSHESLIT